MKKIFFAVFFLFPLLLCYPAAIREPAANPETDFEWRIDGQTVTITRYIGKSLDVVIPERIQGYAVTRIWYNAFQERNLLSVKLPNTLTHIESSAFAENKLKSIVIPDGVVKIESFAFLGNNLESVIIPEGVKIIEYGVFWNNRISSVSLPRSLTRIEWRAFSENKLQEITLPENLENVGSWAFSDNEITSVTINSDNLRITTNAFENNSIVELALHTKTFTQIPQQVFHPTLPTYLPPGRYTLDDDETWIVQSPKDPGVLEQMLYAAIAYSDVALLRNAISLGADVNGRIYGSISPNGNTPLAQALYYDSYGSPPRAKKFTPFNAEIVQILLEAGAIPQYWMLSVSYFYADITKMLLEYGAFTNPESSEHGDPPKYYKRPESLVLHYCLTEEERSNWEDERFIAESTVVLLEYGLDANYCDPQTGQTPLTVALNSKFYSPELVDALLKYVNRPLSIDEYRRLIRLNPEVIYRYAWWYETDYEHEDKWGYDEFVLQDVRQGILNPDDIFDYAATTGTAGLMKGLMPYLAASGRTLLAADGTGLYIDAVNAGRLSVAAVLSTAMDNVFAAKDADGNEYLLEYYAYDYDTIYDSAQKISERSLHQSGPDGTKLINKHQEEIRYSPNELYVFFTYDDGLQLYSATKNKSFALKEIINEEREKHYLEKGREKPNNYNPSWYVANIFGSVLYVYNRVYYGEAKSEYALVDISGDTPSVYILETENLKIGSMTALYEPYTWISLLEGAIDFVIDTDKAYLIKSSGEVFMFDVGKRSLQFTETVSWRDCRISGWKGGERVFVDDEIVQAYNFATGTVRSLGTKVEIPHRHAEGRNYLYEDKQGRRFIVEAISGKAYPEPAEEYNGFALFENGYIYVDEKQRYYTVCFFEGTALKRKLVLSGNAISRCASFSVYGDKIYIGDYLLAFTIDRNTMQVSKSFNTDYAGRNADIYVYMFPFGNDDVVYTYTVDYGK